MCKLSDVFNNCNFQHLLCLLFPQNEEFLAEDALAQYETTKPDRMDFALVLHRGLHLMDRAYVYLAH